MTVGLIRETTIPKIATEQSKFPELVCNVFSDVGDDAVRAHDHFFARFLVCLVRFFGATFFDSHDPASCEAAFRLQKHRALCLQDVERLRPELQAKDVSLVGEQVVADIQTRHRLQMRVHDPIDDECAHVRGVVAAVFELVQRPGSNVEPALVGLVPFGDPRVQVPAVVVKPGRLGDVPDIVDRLLLEFLEADDDVGDLNAHVVDVVLHFDRRAAKPEHPHQRVAERGVAQVADVRGLVGIDGRVLDDRFFQSAGRLRRGVRHACDDKCRTFEIEIQVPVRRRNDALNAGDGADRGREILGDRSRRLSQRARELKGDRDRQVAERPVGRRLDRKRRNLGQPELLLNRRADGVVNALLNRENHEAVLGELSGYCKDEMTLSS